MANLTESPIYEPGIFQLEKSTPPLGGAPVIDNGVPSAGHANAQGLQLANRTAYLKQETDSLDTRTTAVEQSTTDLDTRVDSAETDIDNLQAQVAAGGSAVTLRSDLQDSSDPAKGAALVGFDGQTVSQVLINNKSFSNYTTLRSYTGTATTVRILSPLLFGTFYYDSSDTTSPDNGGTIIVGSNGKRWKRQGFTDLDLRWFGCVGDGVTDDSANINLALLANFNRGGGTVWIQPGMVFRKADTGPFLLMYPGTTLRGAGDSSIILHDDRPTNPRQDMLQVQPGVGGVAFIDFKIKGTVETYPVETNQSQCLTGDNFESLLMKNVTIDGCRFMSTAFSRVKDALIIGCRIRNSMRDGVRLTHSRNVKVIGNDFYKVADDSVALHSMDGYNNTALPCNHIVADNTFEYSQGICVLGAKILQIRGNNFNRMMRAPIRVANDSPLPEGNTPMFAISITENQILDTLALYNDSTRDVAIEVSVRERTSTVPIAGVAAPQFQYNWTGGSAFLGGTIVNPGAWGITIERNTIARSLNTGGVWTDLGDGMLLDRQGGTNPPGFYNPSITSTFFDIGGIRVIGPARGLSIHGNHIAGLGINKTVIKVTSGSAAGVYEDYSIHDNKVYDCPGVGIDVSEAAGLHRAASIRNNIIDLDPLLRHPSHNSDNTWTSNSATTAIFTASSQFVGVAEGNTFSHCAQIVDTPSRLSWGESNVAIWQPNGGTGLDGVATNRGIRYIPSGVKLIHTIYNGDPTNAGFKTILTQPLMQSTSLPSTGTYIYGHVTKANIPLIAGSAGSQYLITGWMRLTTSSTHTLNTDWAQMRSLTGA